MTQKTFIIIPVYDGWKQAERCLENIFCNSVSSAIQVTVVDHGPDDHPGSNLNKKYPKIRIVKGSSNLWWTGATNLGIRDAMLKKATHIMLLNNDCYFDPGALSELLKISYQHPNCIISPSQYDYSSGRLLCEKAYTLYCLGFPTLILPNFRRSDAKNKELVPTKLILGGRGVIIPVSSIIEVGYFNEHAFPHYGSDNDFYLRCRNAGIPMYVIPGCRIYVDSSTTTIAANPGSLTFRQFIGTLYDRRSHRNIHDNIELFRRHFPIAGLYIIGVGLNITRYFLLYLFNRFIFLLALRKKRPFS